ncbi:hypothetical protein DPR00_36045 [Burkholderia pseudomallei]|nr:hypothetical protein BOC43_26525 [Burkholderia pseudomallei]PNX02536.1 hypothetical protein CF641_24825 [Burkholderia pseudomallei]PNX36176.1 hypothetical protein CF642_25880 [Burkholderia pseudomallei]RAP79536.1 hypothetical protein DPR01_36885 [Burkholderia pseudomallei]RAP81368.1 hypothetical protein DPQ97_28785 [Burkholderia pseudomallei]
MGAGARAARRRRARGEPVPVSAYDALNTLQRRAARRAAEISAARRRPPRYYLHAPIIGALASQARHDSRPQSLMIRGVLSPGLVGGW